MSLKKYSLITILLFFVVLSSGCTNLGGNNSSTNSTYQITEKDPTTNHYNDNMISFDYPKTWNIKVGNYSISLFNGRKQITIEKTGINNAKKTDDVQATVPPRREIVSNKTIIIDGLVAEEITYKNVGDSGPSRMEIIIGDGKTFKLYFYAPPDEFYISKGDLDIITGSMKIK